LNIALEDGFWYSCKPNDDKPLSLVYDIIWYSMYIYILCDIIITGIIIIVIYIYAIWNTPHDKSRVGWSMVYGFGLPDQWFQCSCWLADVQ
jgi:hypothetical protein